MLRCAAGKYMLVFRWQQAAIVEVLHKPKQLTCKMVHVLCLSQVNTLTWVPSVNSKDGSLDRDPQPFHKHITDTQKGIINCPGISTNC